MPHIILEDGSRYQGGSFGSKNSCSGEIVFNTGLVGYPESFTDPSYKGQILVLTYPLIGNYGVPKRGIWELDHLFESDRPQISGLVVSEAAEKFSHWNGFHSLSTWLKVHKIPAITGVDTRSLTKKLREKGTMLGEIICSEYSPKRYDPNKDNLVAKVSCKNPIN